MWRLAFPTMVVVAIYFALEHYGRRDVEDCERRGGRWVTGLNYCRGAVTSTGTVTATLAGDASAEETGP